MAENSTEVSESNPTAADGRKVVRTILLDVDGVFVHTERKKLEAWEVAVGGQGVEVGSIISDDEYRTMVGNKWPQYGRLLVEKAIAHGTCTLPEGVGRVEDLTDQQIIDFEAEIDARYNTEYNRIREEDGIPRIERNIKFIQMLVEARRKNPDIKIGLVSSDPVHLIIANIKAAGFDPEDFDVMVSGDDDIAEGRNKPKPDIYDEAKRQLGREGEKALVLEDTLAGTRAAVRSDNYVHPVPHELTTQQDFDEALEAWLDDGDTEPREVYGTVNRIEEQWTIDQMFNEITANLEIPGLDEVAAEFGVGTGGGGNVYLRDVVDFVGDAGHNIGGPLKGPLSSR